MTRRAGGGAGPTYAINVQDALPHVVHAYVAVHRRRNYFCADCSHAGDGIWHVQGEKRALGDREHEAGGGKRARDAPEASDMTSVAAFSRDLRSHIRTCAPRHSSHVTPGRRRLSAITLRSSLPPIMSVLSWAKSRELTFMPKPFK